MKHEQSATPLPLLVHEPQHTDGAIAIAKLPLLGADRIERQSADAKHPPDVDDGFRLGERKIEQFGVADDRLDGQASIERGRFEAGLDRLPLWLWNPVQGQCLDRAATGFTAR